jgi:hypothetical protein
MLSKITVRFISKEMEVQYTSEELLKAFSIIKTISKYFFLISILAMTLEILFFFISNDYNFLKGLAWTFLWGFLYFLTYLLRNKLRLHFPKFIFLFGSVPMMLTLEISQHIGSFQVGGNV